MEWHQVEAFKDELFQIEDFLVNLAANEEQLLTFGFAHALELPGAAEAMAAMQTFQERFSSMRRHTSAVDSAFARELDEVAEGGNLVNQLALISLRLRMARARKPVTVGIATVNQFLMYLPYLSRVVRSKGLFGEEPVSLQKSIVQIERLRSLTASYAKYLIERQSSDDEIFRPSNVSPGKVVQMIDIAITSVQQINGLGTHEIARLVGYLQEAKTEAQKPSPSWSKIIGALVVVAAVTSGLADAPGAVKTVREVIEYIIGASIEKPLQRLLPQSPEARQVVA